MALPADTLTVDNCAREPIHTPGSIQPHGALVAFEAVTSVIRHASDNLPDWLPTGSLPLRGRPLASLIDRASWERIDRAARTAGTGDVRHAILQVRSSELSEPAVALQGLVHRHQGQCILELERLPARDADWLQAHADILSTLRAALDLDDLLMRLTSQVKRFCGFDRVMAYRFHDDWHGEVVAESHAPGMAPFLHLHYPASDIPAQARALYQSNLVRYVPQVDYQPVPVSPWLDLTHQQPLDLSHAALRSVSPIHLQYLKNMGVASTLTLSIIVDGQLWGLVACHHRQPTQVSLRMRQTLEALAIGAGSLVAWQSQRHRIEASRHTELLQQHVMAAFSQVEVPLPDVVEASTTALLRLLGATGGALWHRGEVLPFGAWPQGEAGAQLLAAATRLLDDGQAELQALETLPAGLPPAAPQAHAASGLLALRLAEQAGSGLVWMRPEHRREVTCGGNPDKPVALVRSEGGAPVLTPRASFERWTTLVQGRCRPWTQADLAAARSLLPLRQVLAMRDALRDVHESDLRFRALLELQSDAYWQLDAAGRIVTLSKPLPMKLGPVREQRLVDLFEPCCSAETVDALRQALATGEPFRDVRVTSRARDVEDEFELLLSGDPLRDTHFRVIGFHGTLTDVTQALKVGRELRRREAAEMANRTKSTFLSHVSHELRTPLNAVLGFSQMLADDAGASPEQRKQAASILKAGRWLLAMITDLLDLARIEAGNPAVHLQPTEVVGLIDQAMEHLHPDAQAMSVAISMAARPGPCWVTADPKRLKQVLVNLMSNAIKYNRTGGAVSISVRRHEDTQQVAIAVRDSGGGLAGEQIGHLFEPFNRLGRESQDIHGSGLGLVISRRLVEAMAGRIEVDSQPGIGSCFTVLLPAAQPTEGSIAALQQQSPDPQVLNQVVPPPPAQPRPARSGRVLYVEDEPTNAELMKALVDTTTTAELLVAESAEAGLAMAREMAREQRPSLLLIDINLPGRDGSWLLRQVRDDAALRDVVCIAVTADATHETLARLRQQGFDQCWHKPIDLRWASRAIQAVLDTTRSGAVLPRLAFDQPHALDVLSQAPDSWLDTLDFGVIRLDAQGAVTAYNLRESLLSGFAPEAVIGRQFFTEIAPCMNNPQVAGRLQQAESLDVIVETVLKLRLRSIPARLRLLKRSRSSAQFLFIERSDSLAGPCA